MVMIWYIEYLKPGEDEFKSNEQCREQAPMVALDYDIASSAVNGLILV